MIDKKYKDSEFPYFEGLNEIIKDNKIIDSRDSEFIEKENLKYLKRFVLDIETMQDMHNGSFKMGLGEMDKILIGLYDGIEYHQFDTFKEMLKFIYKNYNHSIVYAHNGGKYDFLYLMNTCVQEKCYLDQIINIGGSIIFTLRYKNKTIKFRDSLKILPSSLAKLSKSYLKIDDRKLEMDYSKSHKIEEIEVYLKRDCEALFNVLTIFEKELNDTCNNTLNKKVRINLDDKVSIASQSFNILLKGYIGKKTRCFLNKEEEDFVRAGYYGGRVEIYKFSGKNLNYYDVNSLYPTVMQKNEYPIGKHFFIKGYDIICKLINHGYLGMVKARITYPKSVICLFPVRIKEGTIYPYGTFEGVYSTPELIRAEKEGAKVEFIEGIFWLKKERIFKEFIDDFYQLKRNSTGAKKEISKLILNSCYGKFGQKRTKQIIISESEALKKRKEIINYNVLGDDSSSMRFYCKDELSYRNRNINPVYASFITAYSRIYLFDFMKKLGFEHIYYCDTDSIICDIDMENRYIDDKELGLFKKEYSCVHEGYFVSPKLYALRIKEEYNPDKFNKIIQNHYAYLENGYMFYDIIKAKGVYKEFTEKMSLDKFKQIVQNKDFKFENKNMIGFKQKFNRLAFKEGDNFVNLDITNKELLCTYNKRIRKGNVSEPIELEMSKEKNISKNKKIK